MAPRKKSASTVGSTQVNSTTTASKRNSLESTQPTEQKTKPTTSMAPPKRSTPKKTAAPENLAARSSKPRKAQNIVNAAYPDLLDVYVFGTNTAGELGLGSGGKGNKVTDVTRPRLNPLLGANNAGVVHLAVGGMHCIALTRDNKVLTWGVNDQGALGRHTVDDGKKAAEEDQSDDDDADSTSSESGLNASEAEPREIDMQEVPQGTVFTSVYAGESVTFAVTEEGKVFGWGSFRGSNGVLGFRPDITIQRTPILIPELKNITTLACGANHVLALDAKGKVYTWGAGEQNQLARRVVSRTANGALIPREFGLGKNKVAEIGCGDYHSFVITDKREVYAWGLNTFGQTGVEKGAAGSEEENTVQIPRLATVLGGHRVKQITGGAHHTVFITDKGEVYILGRIDSCQAGTELSDIPKRSLKTDERGKPRYLTKPLRVELPKASNAQFVAVGTDTSLVVTEEGEAFTWGFSGEYQTGQGIDTDTYEATVVNNTAVRGKTIIGGGIGKHGTVLLGKYRQ